MEKRFKDAKNFCYQYCIIKSHNEHNIYLFLLLHILNEFCASNFFYHNDDNNCLQRMLSHSQVRSGLSYIKLYALHIVYTVDSLYLEHPLSRTSLYLELKSQSLCVSCNLFFSLYLELSLSRTPLYLEPKFWSRSINSLSISNFSMSRNLQKETFESSKA